MRARYVSTSAWRGYKVPYCAVAGCSDTGTAPDSPCPSGEAAEEIAKFHDTVLKPAGIKSRVQRDATSNVFCSKRWVVVEAKDFAKAAALTRAWFSEGGDAHYHLLHDADLSSHPDLLSTDQVLRANGAYITTLGGFSADIKKAQRWKTVEEAKSFNKRVLRGRAVIEEVARGN